MTRLQTQEELCLYLQTLWFKWGVLKINASANIDLKIDQYINLQVKVKLTFILYIPLWYYLTRIKINCQIQLFKFYPTNVHFYFLLFNT
jgi:hypothetical protein